MSTSVRAMLNVRRIGDRTEAVLGIFDASGGLDAAAVAAIAEALRAAITWASPASCPAADPQHAGTSDTGKCPA